MARANLARKRSLELPSSGRSFCWTLARVLVAPGIAIAQTSKVRRIGFLEASAPDPPEELRRRTEPVRALGWIEGQNLRQPRRSA
jgi:hypothetical protein